MNLLIFSFLPICLFLQLGTSVSGYKSEWQTIENRILRKYDRKHRPVHKEGTTTNVKVLMMVNHIEEIVSSILIKITLFK